MSANRPLMILSENDLENAMLASPAHFPWRATVIVCQKSHPR